MYQNLRQRLLILRAAAAHEFAHTPVGASGGICAILAGIWEIIKIGLIERHPSGPPTSSAAPSAATVSHGSMLLPLIEVTVFQIVVCYGWFIVRKWLSRLPPIGALIANVLTVIPIAYITCINAVFFTPHVSDRTPLNIHNQQSITIVMFFSIALIVIFTCEDRTPWRTWNTFLTTSAELVVLLASYLALIVFFTEEFVIG
jgi:hypothetical protein